MERLKGKVIHIQSAEGCSSCLDNYENKKKIEGIEVVEYRELIKNNEIRQQFAGGICDKENEEIGKTYIYIKSLDKYLENTCKIEFEVYKHITLAFSSFVGRLGAKEFSGKVHIVEGKNSSVMNEIKAKIKFAKAGIKVKAEDEKRFEDYLVLERKWTKTEDRSLSEDEYSRIGEEYNRMLENNIDCRTLYDARNPKENNQQEEFSVKLSMSEDLQTSIDVAAKLSSVKIGSIKNDYCSKTQVNKRVEIHYKVKF